MSEPHSNNEIFREASEFRPTLIAYAYSLLRSWELAEDAVQEAYMEIWKKIENYDRNQRLFPWVRAFVRIRCLKTIDARKNEVYVSPEDLDFQFLCDKMDDPWDKAGGKTLSQRIYMLEQCLSLLPNESRKVLFSYYTDASKQIAEEQQRSLRGLRVSMCRLRKRVRKCMRDRLEQNAETAEDFEETVEKYYEKTLTPEESLSLKNSLKESKESREAFLSHTLYLAANTILARQDLDKKLPSSIERTNHNVLKRETLPEGFSANVEPGSRLIRNWTFLGGIAATLLLVFALFFFVDTKQQNRAVAQIDAATEQLVISRDKVQEKRNPGSHLLPGESLVVKKSKGVSLHYIEQEISVTFLTPTTVRFLEAPPKGQTCSLHLQEGYIEVNVGRQNPNGYFEIHTPHARVTVLGTRFRLRASPKRTRIDVLEGLLRFSDRTSDKNVLLAKGQFAEKADGSSITTGKFDPFKNANNLFPPDVLHRMNINPKRSVGHRIVETHGRPFTSALELTITEDGGSEPDISTEIPHAINQDDTLVLEIYIKAREGTQCQINIRNRNIRKYDGSLSLHALRLKGGWNRYVIPFAFLNDTIENEAQFDMKFYSSDVVAIGGLLLKNLGNKQLFESMSETLNLIRLKNADEESIFLSADNNIAKIIPKTQKVIIDLLENSPKSSLSLVLDLPQQYQPGDTVAAVFSYQHLHANTPQYDSETAFKQYFSHTETKQVITQRTHSLGHRFNNTVIHPLTIKDNNSQITWTLEFAAPQKLRIYRLCFINLENHYLPEEICKGITRTFSK